MAKCPVCGAESEGKFCEYCGSPMSETKVQTSDNTSSEGSGYAPIPGREEYPEEQETAKEEYGNGFDAASNEPKITKTMEQTDKKCPSCGGTLVFDPETGGMLCSFCGYTKELPKPEHNTAMEELDFESAKNRSSFDWGQKMKTVICKQCGGETVYDALETADCCPFCGSTSVMPVDDEADVMAPGGVVPFAISQEKAAQLFKNWIGHKWFAPNDAKKSCSAKDINGVYLPYWTYDSDTTSPYSARIGFDKRVKRGDHYETETEWRSTSGVYTEFIDDYTVFASKKSDNNPYIKSVSQFDFTKLRPYSPDFVAGFSAERYSVGLDEGWDVAKKGINQRLKGNIKSDIKKSTRCDRVDGLQFSTVYENITFKYLLAPIWLASYKYRDQIYNIVINGQTGKVGGKAPVSALKVILFIIACIIVLSILLWLFYGRG
ncbi:MAG: TFIIB-type zinc ribbon-containing protein [Clostridiales bacterium]|nr:TFIIB-type zinc ribbon-containing protein [Clostridiales bacterium]